CSVLPPSPTSTLFPYTTLFRSVSLAAGQTAKQLRMWVVELRGADTTNPFDQSGSAIFTSTVTSVTPTTGGGTAQADEWAIAMVGDRKSTRLNSSHEWISYAVFC